jgi:hypothetical protein
VTYTVQKRRFASENELLAFLGELTFSPGEQLGIIAGHFMLMYDDQADRLAPMIYQEATNPRVLGLSQKMAGEFPLKTFKLGVQLAKDFRGKQIASKLALIVNDHAFQTDGWSPQNLKDRRRAGQLRHEFYRQKYPLPRSFFAELGKAGFGTDIVLDNNNPNRTPSDILPKTIRLFSEQALRNYFDQHTRHELRKSPMFTEVQRNGTKSKLMFVGDSGAQSVCLTEDGACGCSGELIEFFVRLSEKSLTALVFFVPDECRLAVEVGVKAFLHTPPHFRADLLRVYVVHGLGGVGISSAKDSPLHLTIHGLSDQGVQHAC